MPPPKQDAAPEAGEAPAKKKKFPLLLILAAGVPLLLGGGAAAAYFFVPSVATMVQGYLPGHADKSSPKTEEAASNKPLYLDLPEMAVTLPNGGRAKQLRIRLSLQLVRGNTAVPSTEILSPRVYDALLTYLRTLRDGEVDGGLALDRLRADLYRRIDLVVGSGVIKDVLITSLVVG